MVGERGAETGSAGGTIDAIGQRQEALAAQHAASADGDRALAEALARAHAAAVEAVRRLDAIAAEIDRAVTGQAGLALDTATGAHEFQRFLIVKQREISAVVSEARALDGATKATLEALHPHYTTAAG
jgi:hypothetical protein